MGIYYQPITIDNAAETYDISEIIKTIRKYQGDTAVVGNGNEIIMFNLGSNGQTAYEVMHLPTNIDKFYEQASEKLRKNILPSLADKLLHKENNILVFNTSEIDLSKIL